MGNTEDGGQQRMMVLFILLAVSLLVASVFLAAFIWSVRSGQYDDTCTPAMRILVEDDKTRDKSRAKPAKEETDHV